MSMGVQFTSPGAPRAPFTVWPVTRFTAPFLLVTRIGVVLPLVGKRKFELDPLLVVPGLVTQH